MRTRLAALAVAATALLALAPAAGASVGFAPAPGSPYTGNFRPQGVAAGDLNGDGRADVVAANANPQGRITVLLANANGSLTPTAASPFASGAAAPLNQLALGDLNRDGKLDLVAGYDSVPGAVVVMLGDGKGGFTATPGSPEPNVDPTRYPLGLRITDVGGDGKLDVVTAGYKLNDAGHITIWAGDGTGNLSAAAPLLSGDNVLYDVDVADLNQDGRKDLVGIHYDAAEARIRYQNAVGVFTAPSAPIDADGPAPGNILTTDVDSDGKLDLVFSNRSNPNSKLNVLRNLGGGTFANFPGSPFSTAADAGYELEAVDFDADGRKEIALAQDDVVDITKTKLSVFQLYPGPTFVIATGSPFGWNTLRSTRLAIGDVDADGQLDAITADGQDTGKVGVLLNTNSGRPTASPAALDLGRVDAVTGKRSAAITMKNTGTGFSRHTGAKITGTNAADFTITGNTCAGQTLKVAATCQLTATFRPKAVGRRSAVLAVSDASPTTTNVPLTGRGVDRVRPVISRVKLSRKRFARGRSRKRGTSISFRLSEKATVTLAFQAKVRRRGKTRYVTKLSLKKKAKKGANKVRFTGSAGRRRLATGRYRLRLVAKDPAGNSSRAKTVGVRVVAAR